MRCFFIVCICCIFSIYAEAQFLQFETYDAEQGLSQNSVYCIAQTKEGFLWAGTQDGLNRFDGKKFKTFYAVTASGKKAFSKMFTALCATSDDRLWTGTTNELLIYNRYINLFESPEQVYKGFKIPPVWIVKICEDRQQRMWILTQKSGLFCYDIKAQRMLTLQWNGEKPAIITALHIDNTGNVFIGSLNEIYQLKQNYFHSLNMQKKLIYPIQSISDIYVVKNQLWAIVNNTHLVLADTFGSGKVQEFSSRFTGSQILRDFRLLHMSDHNTVWAGSRTGGVIKVDIGKHKVEYASAGVEDGALPGSFILSLFTDMEQNTWIGFSGGGIAKFNPGTTKFNLWRKESGLKYQKQDNMIFSIFSNNVQDIYMGTLYGGLLHRNLTTGVSNYYSPPTDEFYRAESKNIYAIIKGEGHLLWLATAAGLYSFNTVSKKFTRYNDTDDPQTMQLCSLIKCKKQNKLLCGGYNGGLRFFNLDNLQWEQCPDKENLLSQMALRVRYMEEREQGDVYLSTEMKALVKYNYQSGVFTSYPELEAYSKASRYFCFDGSNLWIATDDGLIQANSLTLNVKKIWTTENGLPNNYIYSIASTTGNRVWVASNAGLAYLNHQTGMTAVYSKTHGLQAKEFNTASCLKDGFGRIWFGGINGTNMIEPGYQEDTQHAPTPLITEINIMNSPINADSGAAYIQTITLPHTQNFISFEFQCPDFRHSGNTVYRCRLDGVDTNWVFCNYRNYMSYTQLSPGSYRFLVEASVGNGLWSNSSRGLFITIYPPWYNTWWFYILATLSIGASVYALFSYRLSQVKKMHQMQQRIAADLHDDIGASLTSINILSKLSSQQKIDASTRNSFLKKIDRQTSEVTNALRDIVWSINPGNETLGSVASRMKRYASEMFESKNIDYSFQFDLDDENKVLNLHLRQNLYFIFKEGVTNLVKYAESETAIVKLAQVANTICLEISDNGKGFDTNTSQEGNGLANMQRRARAIQATYTLTTQKGEGTQIRLIINI